MKKLVILFLLFVVVSVGVCGVDDVSLVINGEALNFDVPPVIENGRTLVPLRAIFEALEAEVEWLNDTREIVSQFQGKEIRLQINNKQANNKGVMTTLDVPPMLIEGRTLVPLRFVSESMGADVVWDDATKTITITTNKKEIVPVKQEFVEGTTSREQKVANYKKMDMERVPTVQEAEKIKIADIVTGVGGGYVDKYGYFKEGGTFSQFNATFPDVTLDFKLTKSKHNFEGVFYDVYSISSVPQGLRLRNGWVIKDSEVISSVANVGPDNYYIIEDRLKQGDSVLISYSDPETHDMVFMSANINIVN